MLSGWETHTQQVRELMENVVSLGVGVREGLLEGAHLRKVSHSSGGKSALR